MEKSESKKTIEQHLLILQTLEISDYEAIKDIMKVVYADAGGAWTKREFKNQLSVFPEGQVGIEVDGKIVAAALSLIVELQQIWRYPYLRPDYRRRKVQYS